MNEVRRFVPRNLRDDGMIEAHEVAHYTHLNLSQYVSASDYAALAARVERSETALRGAGWTYLEGAESWKPPLGPSASPLLQTIDNLTQQLAEAQGTIARLTDRIDLQCDEFQRISALTENDEIKGLCARAVKDIRQHVPVIQQRDQAEQQVARLRECVEYYAQTAIGARAVAALRETGA